jgi:hypothetical protein
LFPKLKLLYLYGERKTLTYVSFDCEAKNKSKMGNINQNMTARILCASESIDADTLRMRFVKLRKISPQYFPNAWRIDANLNENQVQLLLRAGERKGGAKREKKHETIIISPAETILPVEPKSEKLVETNWRASLFVCVSFAIIMCHSGLIWYDMSRLWAVPGAIGGGIVFAFIFSGLILMSDKSEKLMYIKENMMWAVGALESLAIVVHQATFYRAASEAYVAGLGVEYTWGLAAIICLCSIGATIFYKKVIS